MTATPKAALQELAFDDADAWQAWLDREHATSPGVWLRIAKSSAGVPSVQYPQALEVALCYGWIDGVKRRIDADYWVQKFTPRAPRSIWSKVNREKVLALIENGRMRPAGLREIERARADGRWDAAYDSVSKATVPPELEAALAANPVAATFFATLNSHNRFAILHRTQTAKKPETRARRIAQFVQMLERGEKIHP